MAEPTIRQLQYFLAVLDHGSVTAAAKESHVSQSALSMALSQLEAAFAEPLFTRSKAQKVVPTPAALRLAPHARSVIETIEQAHAAVSEEKYVLRGLLRVGCLTTLSPNLMPALAQAFADRYPGIALRIFEGGAVELQDMVRRGQLDVAFLYRRLLEHDLARQDLARATLHVMLPGNHVHAQAASVSVRDILDLPLILLDIPPTADAILGILMGLGVDSPPRLRSSNIETIRGYVALGLGFCLTNTVPSHRIGFGDRTVAYVPLADPVPQNAITAVTSAGHAPSARTQIAIDLVRDYLQVRFTRE
ncbi:LysR family transcriptional regulator [Arthrobacter sp. UNC362MFTsu5.1]|uniref:LysR family transcriptional regulator n=1 Tax=Arthrobacter sp. UNC362MFTsu5.1 TaxID=1449044 RepID=UPI0004843749|nr:LysR family transcriptional regulator [Arthrobacter sp. UNC362MFTsu5.1]